MWPSSMELKSFAKTDVKISAIGLGTWGWGDWYWGYGSRYVKQDLVSALSKSLDLGVNLIDTAEAYGWGLSEKIIGEVLAGRQDEVFIVTKYLPLHIFSSSMIKAVENSLKRLQTRTIDLYLVHRPSPIMPISAMMRIMESLVKEGKIKYIGVSNFNLDQVRKAQYSLRGEGLSCIENEYSILQRSPETNGLLRFCAENKMTFVAYSPLAQGMLTGRYPSGFKAVRDLRRFTRVYSEEKLRRIAMLVDSLRMIGDKYGKSIGQVSLNWLIRDPMVIPIPGAKNASQAEQNAESSGWRLSDSDWQAIERTSRALD